MIVQPQWQAIRTTAGVPTFVGADSAQLFNNTNHNLDWDSHPAGRYANIPQGYDTVLLGLLGSHASAIANKTATLLLWGSFEKGPAHYIGQLAAVFGLQRVNELPYPPNQDVETGAQVTWADALTVTSSSLWPTDPVEYNTATNQIAIVKFPTYGIKRLHVEVTVVDAGVTVMPVMVPLVTV